MADVTRLLDAAGDGDEQAAAEVFPLVYDELRKLAAARLVRERPGHTFGATDLVHEAYVRLVDQARPQQWSGRGHFFAAAARAMRRILVEKARRKLARKNGGDRERVPFDQIANTIADNDPALLIDLHEALEVLERHDPLAAELVKLRVFIELSHQEAAEVLGVSRGDADRLWAIGRAWLYNRIHPTDQPT